MTVAMIINTVCAFSLELIGYRFRLSGSVTSLIFFFLVSFQNFLMGLFFSPARRKEGSEKADGEGEEEEDSGREEEASQYRPSERGQSEVSCFNKCFERRA